MAQHESDPLLVAIHIPKTAGSTLRRLIGRQYGAGYERIGNAIMRPDGAENGLRKLAAAGWPRRAIAGHLVFGLRDLLPEDARYVTVLREPVDRTLSHYSYLVAPRDPSASPHGLLLLGTPQRTDMSLEECLEDRRYLLDNLQTRMIVSHRSPWEELPPGALEQAKSHLRDRFAFVGTTERFDELVALLTVSLGWRTGIPFRRRVSEERLRRSDLSPGALRAVEESNTLDLELYAFAGELLERAFDGAGPRAALERDVIRRTVELRSGAAPAAVPGGDLHSELVEARAGLLVAQSEIARLRRKLADPERARRRRSRRPVPGLGALRRLVGRARRVGGGNRAGAGSSSR